MSEDINKLDELLDRICGLKEDTRMTILYNLLALQHLELNKANISIDVYVEDYDVTIRVESQAVDGKIK